jgi:possible UDP-N-acetylmuramoylalanyl-D-glutamate--2, 6-diaminopimelate ligase
MRQTFTTITGKTVRAIAQARGGGSALPGLFVEKIDKNFISRTLASLPYGVVVISGTNGKTTTTKMVVELLESQGLRVFTNRTGSNFTRGVAAALLGAIDYRGRLSADIAVLELDEAHAVHFVRAVKPRFCLLLNVMRDQLDRFGEIDNTANMLLTIAKNTTECVVLNRDDPRLSHPNFIKNIKVSQRSFGINPKYLKTFPSDDSLHSNTHVGTNFYKDDTSLEEFDNQNATIAFADKKYSIDINLRGIYNLQNATGAIALVRAILGEQLNIDAMFKSLSNIKPAFGRGEQLIVGGQPLELVLVKNPAGFRLALASFNPTGYATMIAINDAYADGRDMSWLWDVDFESLQKSGVFAVSGVRAYDMAIRLEYDEVSIDLVDTDIATALKRLIDQHPNIPKRIYCTYTAMLALRKLLSRYTEVEEVR